VDFHPFIKKIFNMCATLPSEGVEDIMFNLCSIYIEEVFVGFSPP
jgi:hypothetical protein